MNLENYINSSEYGKPVRESLYFSPVLKENTGRSSPIRFLEDDEVARKEDGSVLISPLYFTATKQNADGSVKRCEFRNLWQEV